MSFHGLSGTDKPAFGADVFLRVILRDEEGEEDEADGEEGEADGEEGEAEGEEDDEEEGEDDEELESVSMRL